MTLPIAPKICKTAVPYVPRLSSEFQGSTFSHFEALAISACGCRKIVNFARKETKGLATLSVAEVPITYL